MAYNTRARMPVSQRAKQFMPFSAVKGLEEALAKQERSVNRESHLEFGEEQVEAINRALCKLEKGAEVSVTYFSNGEYQTIRGIVEKIDAVRQTLRVGRVSVPFEDIQTLDVRKS